MKIILDERETALFSVCTTTTNITTTQQIEKRVLNLGDILIVSSNSNNNDDKKVEEIQLIIERKSLSDLVASIKDGRYEEQSHRLQHASGIPTHNIIYIVEGMFSQLRSPQDKKMVLSSMTSLSFFKGFSVIRTCSVTETAEFIINMADKIERDLKKGKKPAFSQFSQIKVEKVEEEETKEEIVNTGEEAQKEEEEINPTKKYCEVVKKVKKENITKENMGEIILCQIPGISSTTAIAIMNYVDHSLVKLLDILKTSSEELQNIKIGKMGEKQRKISKKNIENMMHFLL
jgi:ERCC4-type nuclease